ncbi:hypothetical protein SDC9_126025 [bioreactor metagenome]|uniref:Uncharacterized protein n=1 Tax=bioreactor metagenome TaxID=1076179 RepID=A0A645CQ26_9ZZZZ
MLYLAGDKRLIRLHPIAGSSNADRRPDMAGHVENRRADADQSRLDLAVVHGIAVQTGLDQLVPHLLRIGESSVCHRLLIQHPLAVLIHIFLRLKGQHGLAATGGVSRSAAPHSGIAHHGTMGLHLIQVENVMLQQCAEIDGLLHHVAQPLHLRSGQTSNIGAAQDRAGEQIQPRPDPIALSNGILLQILPLYQGGNLPEHRGRGKIQPLHQSLERPLSSGIHKAL